MLERLLCKLFNHKLIVIWSSKVSVSQKLYCTRCKRFYAINYDSETFFPWDYSFELMKIGENKNADKKINGY